MSSENMVHVSLRAVIPANIRRRWDAIAIQQLAERAAYLEDEKDHLLNEVLSAQMLAEHWFQNCQELTVDAPGITIDGRLVRVSDGAHS